MESASNVVRLIDVPDLSEKELESMLRGQMTAASDIVVRLAGDAARRLAAPEDGGDDAELRRIEQALRDANAAADLMALTQRHVALLAPDLPGIPAACKAAAADDGVPMNRAARRRALRRALRQGDEALARERGW